MTPAPDKSPPYRMLAFLILGGSILSAGVLWFLGTGDYVALDDTMRLVLKMFAGLEIVAGLGLFVFFMNKDKKVL